MKSKISLILSLVTIVILLMIIPGCSSAKTTTPDTAITTTATATTPANPYTAQELQKIVADSAAVMKGITVFKMGMDVSTSVKTDNAAATLQSVKANISFDQTQKQMIMDAEMTADDGSGSKQTQAVSLYVLTDYIYMKATVPEMGEQWIKMPVSEEILNSFDANMAEDQMDILVDPASIEWVGYATVSNTECYVLKITPNEAYLRDFAQEQTKDTIDWSKVGNTNDLFKEMWYQVSIAKDTKYVQEIKFKGVIEVTGDMAASGASNFDKMTTGMEGTIGMHDFNTPISFTLPDEAKNAMEISPEALLGQ